jgi:hypothetical protein
MAELELSVFDRQCWERRIGDRDRLAAETLALETQRNAAHATVRWQFTAQVACSRLHRPYPSVSP